MRISASVCNTETTHVASVATGADVKSLNIGPKNIGRGSSVNGGELLLAALATCMCNDLFREAGRRGVEITDVEVQAEADFPAEGAPAQSLRYRVRISGGDEAALRELVRYTDTVAEIHNTIRNAIPVVLEDVET